MLLATVSERQFMEWVISTAHRNGWLCHHVHDSRKEEWGTDAGFPDLVLARNGRVIFAELKVSGGRTTPSQREWMYALAPEAGNEGGVSVALWRPTDEAEIEKVLA
jgi:hypothetical protein